MFTRVMTLIISGVMVLSSQIQAAGHWDKVNERKQQPKCPTIKVLVQDGIAGATLNVQGRFNIFDPAQSSRMSTRFAGKKGYVQPLAEGIKWGEVFPGVYQMRIIPDDEGTVISVNGIEYLGSIYVYQVEGTLSIVNEVSIEDYVNAILTVQFKGNIPEEALSALAIAARTDATYTATHAQNAFFHVVADKVGYSGHASKIPGSAVDNAMTSTKGLILSRNRFFEGGLKPVYTFCLAKEYGNDKVKTNWDLEKARELAQEGFNASKILAYFFPQTVIDLMETLPKSVDEGLYAGPHTGVADGDMMSDDHDEELR